MVVPPSSKRLTIRNQRPCSKCGTSTWHICYGIRYEKPEPSSDFYEKHLFWSCERCGEPSEETKQIPEPTEQTMLLTRLLRLVEENNLDGSTLEVKGRQVVFTASFPTYDLERMRRIALRLQEGYITAAELSELQNAGLRDREKRSVLLKIPFSGERSLQH